MRDFLKHARDKKNKRVESTKFTDSHKSEKIEVHLALMKLDKVCISKIACSNTHTLAVSFFSNTWRHFSVRIQALSSPGVKINTVSYATPSLKVSVGSLAGLNYQGSKTFMWMLLVVMVTVSRSQAPEMPTFGVITKMGNLVTTQSSTLSSISLAS